VSRGEWRAFAMIVTPFDESGRLDEAGTRAHLRRMADAGHGVYVGGVGHGEGRQLTRAEMRRLMAIAVDELKGRVPVRASSLDPFNAAEALEMIDLARDTGVDAVQVYSPLAPGATPFELEAYFSEVLSGSKMPVVVSIHHHVGYEIPLSLVKRLVERYDHIVTINTTFADEQLLDAVGEKVDVHVADASAILSHFAFGGRGFVSAEANIVPNLCRSFVNAAERGDWNSLRDAYARIARLAKFLKGPVRMGADAYPRFASARGVKGALEVLGLPGGYPRSPQIRVTEDEKRLLRQQLDELDIRRLEAG